MQDRVESIERLDQVSEKIRMATHLQYNLKPNGNPAQCLTASRAGEMEHREYFISDGQEGMLNLLNTFKNKNYCITLALLCF